METSDVQSFGARLLKEKSENFTAMCIEVPFFFLETGFVIKLLKHEYFTILYFSFVKQAKVCKTW